MAQRTNHRQVLPDDVIDQPATQEIVERRQLQVAPHQVGLQLIEPLRKGSVQVLVTLGHPGGAGVQPYPVFLIAEVVVGIGTQLQQQVSKVLAQASLIAVGDALHQFKQDAVLQVDGRHACLQTGVPSRPSRRTDTVDQSGGLFLCHGYADPPEVSEAGPPRPVVLMMNDRCAQRKVRLFCISAPMADNEGSSSTVCAAG